MRNQLNDVDELLLKSDVILQRSQRDEYSAGFEHPYHSNSNRSYPSQGLLTTPGLNELALRSDVTSREGNHVIREEEEDRFASATIQTEDDRIGETQHQLLEATSKSKQMSLEDELRSMTEGVVDSPTTSTLCNHREKLSQELTLVKSSLKQQKELENQLEHRLSIEQQQNSDFRQANSLRNETIDEPEILMTMSLQNPLQNSSKQPFLSSDFLNWANNNQSSSSKLLSSSANRDINHVRSENSSSLVLQKQKKMRSAKTRKTSNSRFKVPQKILHMQGCPAHSSNLATSIGKAQRSSSGFVTGSNQMAGTYTASSPKDDHLSRRTRNDRQLQHSLKRTTYASKSSKSRSNSKSNGGEIRKKRMTPNQKSAKGVRRHVQDAACSPIKFSGTFGNGLRESQQMYQGKNSLSSSAVGDIRFVGETSYRSSVVAPAQDTINAIERAEPEPIATPQVAASLLTSSNQNFMVRNDLGNSNPNIFQSLKSTDIKSVSNMRQQTNSQRGERQVEPWRQNLIESSRQSQMVGTSDRLNSQDGSGVRLSNTIVMVRQALQEAAEISGAPRPVNMPKHRMQLNLKLLKQKEEQNQLRSSHGSIRTLISAGLNQQSATSSQVVRHHPNCEMTRAFRKSAKKAQKDVDLGQMPNRCAICSLSSFTVHPSVFKAQQRVKERTFLESHKELTQHLRNPLTVAKQLRKHLQLQKTVKTQFEAIVGSEGQRAIKNLNRNTSNLSQSKLLQPLRQKPLKFTGRNHRSERSVLSTAARSHKTTGGMRRRQIVRLRYAPHLVGSSPVSGAIKDDAARDAINIIVNERHRSCSQKSHWHKRRSLSREQRSERGERNGRAKIHRLLSADDYCGRQGGNRIYRKWSNRSQSRQDVDRENIYQVRQSSERRSRHQRQAEKSNQQSYVETSSNAKYSAGSTPDYRTGHFNMQELRGSQNYYRVKSQSVEYRDHSEREAQQRARLDAILLEKKRNYFQRGSDFRSKSVSSNTRSPHDKFETFNDNKISVYGGGHNANPQPLRIQPHRARNTSRDSSQRSQSRRVNNRSEASHRSWSASAHSRSNPGNNNFSSGREDSVGQDQAAFMPSYDDQVRSNSVISEAEERHRALQHIGQDMSGSLRLRIAKAKELAKTVSRGVKDIQNMNSPLSSGDDSKKIVFSNRRGSNKHKKSSDLGKHSSQLTEEPRVANQNSQAQLISSDHGSSTAGYAEHRMSALRTNHAVRQSPGSFPQGNLDRIYERSQGVSDRAARSRSAFSAGRQDCYSPQIPRETFMREISGVKYDYRPGPREDGRESYYRNAAVKNHQAVSQVGGGPHDHYRIYNNSMQRADGQQKETQTRSQPRSYSMFEHFSQTSANSTSQAAIIERVQHEFLNENFPRNSSYFRMKPKHLDDHAYSRKSQQSRHVPTQAVTTKSERSKSREKRQKSTRNKYKPYQLNVQREQKRAAMIPKLKNFAKQRPRRVSFDSNETSDSEDKNDFDSAKHRLSHMEMRHRLNFPPKFSAPDLRSPSPQSQQKQRLCNHSRCSASKENAKQRNSFMDDASDKTRRGMSRSRSRMSNGQRLKTLAELKQSIRRLQKPTFSSRMHTFKKSLPAQFKGRDRGRGAQNERQPQDDEVMETPHCDRDAHYWHGEVEAFSQNVSSYPTGGRSRSRSNNLNRSKLMVNDGSASANRLMPLGQLRQISQVMNHIMGVGQQVDQLKSHLQKTQNQLLKALKKGGVDLSEDYGAEANSQGFLDY